MNYPYAANPCGNQIDILFFPKFGIVEERINLFSLLKESSEKENFSICGTSSIINDSGDSANFLLIKESHFSLYNNKNSLRFQLYTCRSEDSGKESARFIIEGLSPFYQIETYLERRVDLNKGFEKKLAIQQKKSLLEDCYDLIVKDLDNKLLNDPDELGSLLEGTARKTLGISSNQKSASLIYSFPHQGISAAFICLDKNCFLQMATHTYPEYQALVFNALALGAKDLADRVSSYFKALLKGKRPNFYQSFKGEENCLGYFSNF